MLIVVMYIEKIKGVIIGEIFLLFIIGVVIFVVV